MMNPLKAFLEKFFTKYAKYESGFRLMLDMLFFFMFIWFGIHWQPEIIYVCNQTLPFAWNTTINNTVYNVSLIP